MQYRVRFVEDDQLPTTVDWVIVNRTEDGIGPFLFIKESRVSGELLTEAWRAWQVHGGRARLRLPEPRDPYSSSSRPATLVSASRASSRSTVS